MTHHPNPTHPSYPAATCPSPERCWADLVWLLQSPPLLSLIEHRFSAQVQQFSAVQQHAITHWLKHVDRAQLHTFVAQAMPTKAAMRLGRYAERLMEYFLRHADFFTLTAANVQLKNTAMHADHTTLGEFDYLLHDASGTPFHWELAVKFYLCHTTNDQAVPHDFKGPAGKDTLALKLGKVFGKQLQHRPPAPYDAIAWQAAAYARGWLFYPYGQVAPPCDALNPLHPNGWWQTLSQFEQATFEPYSQFVHLPRLQWLAPYLGNDLTVMSHSEAVQYVRTLWSQPDAQRAAAGQMLACVAPNGAMWQEINRGFVVPISLNF